MVTRQTDVRDLIDSMDDNRNQDKNTFELIVENTQGLGDDR